MWQFPSFELTLCSAEQVTSTFIPSSLPPALVILSILLFDDSPSSHFSQAHSQIHILVVICYSSASVVIPALMNAFTVKFINIKPVVTRETSAAYKRLTEMESSSQKFFHFCSVSSSIWAQLTWYFAIGNGVTALKTTHPNVVSFATELLWSPPWIRRSKSSSSDRCNCRDVSNLCFGRERIEYYHKSLWDLVPQLDSWLGTRVGDM
ncbi:hypothetical protein T08_10277 [Trichinella sp. T8]|nr:hypothetical protein T08_10277 [Trichinella sp. T8]